MKAGNDHMGVEDFLCVMHARVRPEKDATEPQLEEHLRQCQHCARMLQEYQRFMSRVYEFGRSDQADGKCPVPGAWGELASGILSQEEAGPLLKHAASCRSCVEELLHALDVLDSNEPLPQDLQQHLTTATADWQKRFAANIAARQVPSQVHVPQALPVRRGWRLFSGSWAYAAVAALLLLTVGIGFYVWLGGKSSEALIQEAYSQQRTVEMRLPGAGYGPIQVERADGRSQISSPQALLEAQVLIKRGLEKNTDDADLLRQKAEADLLNWNYQPALETLNHAARLKSNSFALLVDTATAYFERAEATANPADYEAGLQSLGDALQIKPDDPSALFNRAIIYERLYFYGRAIADWEQFLKVEKDPGWRKEAEQRLQEIRQREQHRSLWRDPEQLTPAQFRNAVLNPGLTGIEEYVKAAERRIVPQIATTSGEEYQAGTVLATILQSRHSDSFLKDLIASAASPQFHQAARALGESSSANGSGRYEEAYSSALQAAALFRRLGSNAGMLSAQFEQAYALQFESKAGSCQALADQAAVVAHHHGYFLLEAELLLEQAICSNMNRELGRAKDLDQRALALAKAHDYSISYLRGLALWATLECDAGDESSAWAAIRKGLGLFWESDLPPVRAYSFYSSLDEMAERAGHTNVRFAALSEALSFRAANPSRTVEASARSALGDVALRLGELPVAQEQFALAQRIFAAQPPTDSTRWHELEAQVALARVQSLQNKDTAETAAALVAALPEVQRLSNRYLEFRYYDTLADLKLKAGDVAAAREFLEKAIAIAETGARSLRTWQERSAWMDQHRQPFAQMVELLLQSGEEERALQKWEDYRLAATSAVKVIAASNSLDSPSWNRPVPVSLNPSESVRSPDHGGLPITSDHPIVITYAFGPDGLMIWARRQGELHSAYVPVSYHDVQRAADAFLSECSRPDSDLGELRGDGQLLYSWLIQPVARWLGQAGHLVIEPDGMLGGIPFEALVDASGNYLGAHYAVTVAAGVPGEVSGKSAAVAASDRAVIAAALAAPPGAPAEARAVAAEFDRAEVLLGGEASVAKVEHALENANIFHFAGHASLGRNGAAMRMADGLLDSEHAGIFEGQRLRAMKLAVFSACATARPSEVSDWNSLVSEFLHAGAQNVVASRWNVDSEATTEFIRLFYVSALSGRYAAGSLQSAAADFRKTPARAHPYYWAAFSAFGQS